MLKQEENLAKDFTLWLEGFIDSKNSLDVSQVKRIREKLNSVFQHEIDPSMPDEDGSLQETHDGFHHKPIKPNLGKTPGSTILYRC